MVTIHDEPVGQPERPQQPEPPQPDRTDRANDPRRNRLREEDPQSGRRRTPKPHEDGVPAD